MRCFFHLVSNHDEIVDDTGIEVDNLENAKAQALLAIEELRRELGEEVQDWSGWRLDIVCPSGTVLYTTQLTETRALTDPGRLKAAPHCIAGASASLMLS